MGGTPVMRLVLTSNTYFMWSISALPPKPIFRTTVDTRKIPFPPYYPPNYLLTMARECSNQVGNIQYLFHGTQRTCRTGDHHNWTKPCHHSDCFLCSIIKCSFNLSLAGILVWSPFSSSSYPLLKMLYRLEDGEDVRQRHLHHAHIVQ